jgi:hypothetical protein
VEKKNPSPQSPYLCLYSPLPYLKLALLFDREEEEECLEKRIEDGRNKNKRRDPKKKEERTNCCNTLESLKKENHYGTDTWNSNFDPLKAINIQLDRERKLL